MPNNFDPSSIAFAVITYYPKWYGGNLQSIKHTDKVRGDLAIDFFKEASKRGYQVVAADGKSSKTFRKTISKIPLLTIINRRSVKRSLAKKQAIKKASGLLGAKVIVLTEAEKISLVTDCLPELVNPIINDEADIIIPKRSATLFQKTYPEYMFQSEREGNKLYNDILRINGFLKDREEFDAFFGPRVFKNTPEIRALFTRGYRIKIDKKAFLEPYFDPETYSTTFSLHLIKAFKKGLRVKSVEVPFSYPMIQKDNEEKGARELFEEKRRTQRVGFLVELLYVIHYLNQR